MRRFFLTGSSAMLICWWAVAQDSLQVTTLKEVVVSATRTEQRVIEIPRSVTVITRAVIEESVYQSLGDLLNAQSGLFVVGTNQTPGTNQNVFMRGANSNQVAVMVDGVRITDPSSPNSAIDLSEISLTNVERVEIIRGSHSTMFGGAAIGGVINIITVNNGRPGFHGSAAWQGGVIGKDAFSSTENLDLSYTFENGLYLNTSIFQQDVSGLDASEKTVLRPSFTADRDDFHKTDVFVKAGYRAGPWDGSVFFKKSHQLTEIDNGAFSDDDNNYLKFDRLLTEYRIGYTFNPAWRLSAFGSLSPSKRFYENDSSRISDTAYDKIYSRGTYHGKLQTHEVQVNYQHAKVQGVLGAGMYHEKMFFDAYFFYNDPAFPFESVTNYDSLDLTTTTRYAFGQVSYALAKFNLSAGSRVSRHSTSGNFMTVELNPSYTINNLLVYGSVSTGFNSPSLYQLYDPTKGFMAYTTRGNPQLKAERSVSLEVGVKKEFASGSYVTVSGFQTRVKNSIEYVYLWNGAKAIEDLDFTDDRGDSYINVAEQVVQGLEVDGFVEISDKVSVQGNFTALHTTVEVNADNLDNQATGGNHIQLYNLGTFLDSDVSQDDLVRRPGFTAYGLVTFRPINKLSIFASYRHTGKRFDSAYEGGLGPYGALGKVPVDAYHLVDFGVNWQPTEVIGVALKVENILDEQYRELIGFQTRGRSAYVKLTARW
jgi:vitamin B12 transporter